MADKRRFFLQWGEGPAVVIKPVLKNIFDVFVGNAGWSGWSRVERKDGDIQLLTGRDLDQRTYNYVKGRVIK